MYNSSFDKNILDAFGPVVVPIDRSLGVDFKADSIACAARHFSLCRTLQCVPLRLFLLGGTYPIIFRNSIGFNE